MKTVRNSNLPCGQTYAVQTKKLLIEVTTCAHRVCTRNSSIFKQWWLGETSQRELNFYASNFFTHNKNFTDPTVILKHFYALYFCKCTF